MRGKIDEALKDKLEAILASGITEDGMKALKKAVDNIAYDIESDVMFRLKDEMAPGLVEWVAEMAGKAVDEILNGNEDQMRRYLGCEKRSADGSYIGWTGRSDSEVFGRKREDHEQHPVIHGRLFEQGAVALRKKIVDAHRDLITSERILDLEDQVKSLVAQLNKANDAGERMAQRLRDERISV